MDGRRVIWVLQAEPEVGERVREEFARAQLLNPVRIFTSTAEFVRAIRARESVELILFDFGLSETERWQALAALRESQLIGSTIALVDDAAERLLDFAYEQGIKSYLRKGFSFPDFLERVRFLDQKMLLTAKTMS